MSSKPSKSPKREKRGRVARRTPVIWCGLILGGLIVGGQIFGSQISGNLGTSVAVHDANDQETHDYQRHEKRRLISSSSDSGSGMQPADPPVSASIEAQKAQETLYQKLQHELQLQMQTAKAELAAGLARLTLKNMLMARMDAAQGSVPEAAPKPDHNTVVAALSDGKSQTQDAPETAAQTALVTASLALDVVPVPSARPQAPRKPVAAGLAYAPAPELQTNKGGIFDGLGKVFKKSGKIELPGKHMGIAVYEISTATVHMPDGTKLEAHSGLGKMKDNPKYVYRKNRGPTPPNVYNLRMRERRYHGVEAIRMLPVDVAAMRGRDGMLTHTSLVRGTNGSHGCVAFKDYNKFLSAFKSGKVKKMIVVPQLDELPTYMASL